MAVIYTEQVIRNGISITKGMQKQFTFLTTVCENALVLPLIFSNTGYYHFKIFANPNG